MLLGMGALRGTKLTMPTPPRFDLAGRVVSYGWYALAPNRWDADTATLHRVLNRDDGTVVRTSIRHDKTARRLIVQCDAKLDRGDAEIFRGQIARMLRLDEDFKVFHRLHQPAKKRNFGPLFRSPTLFEDLVKTITGCNMAWSGTTHMNAMLCEHFGSGAFPTAARLAAVDATDLKAKARVGYRAERIVRLAQRFVEPDADILNLSTAAGDSESLFKTLRGLYGFGDYAAANALQHLGRYDRMAIDSETYRHFREKYDTPTPRDAAGLRRLDERIRAHYRRYAPFDFLAYWFELWTGYAESGAFDTLAH